MPCAGIPDLEALRSRDRVHAAHVERTRSADRIVVKRVDQRDEALGLVALAVALTGTRSSTMV